MAKKHLLTLLLVFSLIQGCKQPVPDDKIEIENSEMNIQLNEEDDYMLTIEEARQALLRKHNPNDEEERGFRDHFEGYPDGRFDYNYEDYVVIEIISFWPDEEEEWMKDDIGGPIEIVSQWECNLKEGLFREITHLGSTFGRFRKNKHGEWITTVEGASFVGSYGHGQ